MPEMTPVAAGINPPNPMQGINTLSGIMGLQKQQADVATAQAQSQQAQQKNRELQGLSNLIVNGVKKGTYTNTSGELDSQRFLDDAMKVAPIYGGEVRQQVLDNALQIVTNQRAHLALGVERQHQMGSALTALAQKDNPTVKDVTDTWSFLRTLNKDPDHQSMLDSMLMQFPGTADAATKKKLLQNWAAAAIGGENAPTQIDTGGQVQGGMQSKFSGAITPTGNAVSKTLPPQIIEHPLTGGPAQIGGAEGTRPKPIGGPSFQPYPGQQKDIETFRSEVQNVRTEAQQAPLARNINAQILRLSSDARTGPGSDVWQHVIGAVGAPFGLSPSASYQEVGKFLEKNAIAAMQAMGGPPSDSRLEAAAKANGGTSFSPEALQTVTKFNDATNTALEQYRQGIDHAVGMGANVDYSKLPKFKSDWAKNFDVNVFRVENALRDGDSQELTKIKSELGPAKLKALAEKRKKLTELSQGQ